MGKTKSEVEKDAIYGYLDQIPDDCEPDPAQEQADILALQVRDMEIENQNRDNDKKWRYPQALSPPNIATIVLRL